MARYLVLGDIHGCKEYIDSLEANRVFDGIDGLLFTGDIGGYGPDPAYCYEYLINLKRRFEGEGKVFKGSKGNHEIGFEERLTNPEVQLTGEGFSETAEIGFVSQAEQLFGSDVCTVVEGQKTINASVIRRILVDGWADRLRSGNNNILNQNYVEELRKKTLESIISKIEPNATGWRRRSLVQSTLRSAVQQSLKFLPEYSDLLEKEKRLNRAVEILSFIVNLPYETKVGRVKIMHTFAKSNDKKAGLIRAKYVVDDTQLGYMNRVTEALKGHPLEPERYVKPSEIFDSSVFDDCDVLILGHVHSSSQYKSRGKRIIMTNSPFPRDGKGIRAPVLYYDGGLTERKDFKYNFSETERKLKETNPRFLKQIELYRSAKR